MSRRILALALLFAAACTGELPPPAFETCTARSILSEGQRLPDCTFETLDGGRLALRDLEGKPAVLNFWAEWCVACTREMPDIEAVHQELGDRVAIVGMDLLGVQGETTSAAKGFVERTGVTYRVAYDRNGGLYNHFGNVANPIMPLTVFVDERGRLAGLRFGEIDAEKLRSLLEEHLQVR